MPFVSPEQRRYLFKFKPDLAKRWAHRYGAEPRGRQIHRMPGGRMMAGRTHPKGR